MLHRKRLLAIGLAAAMLAGCGGIPVTQEYKRLYLFQSKEADGVLAADPATVGDQDVLAFSSQIASALRERMSISRIARQSAGTVQVLTAAVAAGLGATTANLGAITALAGTSSVMPQLEGIFGATERAEAYAQGAHYIENAQAEYFAALAARRTPASARLTPEAAVLFKRTMGALSLVEKALNAQLPTIRELQDAGAQTQAGLVQDIALSRETLDMAAGEKQNVLVTGGLPILNYAMHDEHIATAVLKQNAVLEITARGAGGTELVLTNPSGAVRTLAITVK
ncbi:MAG: hypothetical protein HY749_10750 [Gammaproteobacteria bacterium]|nr:hypothetical protein [Gammaproteobacteria bacterium]